MSTDEDRLIADLQERIRVLAAGLGVAPTFEIPAEVRRLANDGETVRAVKELRRRTPARISLVAAKRMVDALAAE